MNPIEPRNTPAEEKANSRHQGRPVGVPRVLCAAVPFGANNIGDEAIIAGVVRLIRQGMPQAQITVATGDPETTQRALKVQTCPPFGFIGVPATGPEVERAVSEHDLLIWSGATGLSDYPEIPLGLMQIAHRLRKRTAILCVGMNEELNPHLYQVRSRWRPTYDLIRRCTLGAINLAAWLEAYRRSRTYRRMREVLPRADLLVVRDPETEAALRRAGVQAKIVVGTDAALGLTPSPLDKVAMPDAARRALTAPGSPRIALCLSAQDPPKNLPVVISVLDRVMADTRAAVFGIPINFVTDARLMNEMRPQFKARDRVLVVEGIQDPEDVAGVLGQMDVIVSSRLHALILGSLSDTPLVGIRRGTKIDAFLRPYGVSPAGSFEDLKALELERQIRERLAQGAEWRQRASALRLQRKQALAMTGQLLKSLLEEITTPRR
jgi:polysaccharide pyruvyl transferase WcaK-like protein